LVFGHWHSIGIWLLGFGIFSQLAGCCNNPPPIPAKPSYTGPTDPMAIVIRDIDRNSLAVPTLWTQLTFTARFKDEKNHVQSESGDGGLSYTRPESLLLKGSDAAVGPVFEVGSNDQEYWVIVRSSVGSSNYWWGHQANVGKAGVQAPPIDPQLLIEVLGISLHGTNFLQQPVPVMRFDNENDGSYVLDYNVRGLDRWITEKEVWYTRDKKLPTRVLLYDANGRVILAANLSNHGPVQVPNLPKEKWPTVARHYDLSFPDNGNQITFDFDEPATQHVDHHIIFPNARTFKRPDPGGNDKVIQIDR
jgi:hypothetical protein